VTPKQIAGLQTFRQTTKDAAAANRALAVLLLVQNGDLSYALYSIDHIRRLKYAYLRRGTAALLDHRRSNRERVLTKPERGQVIAALQTKQPRDVIPGCADERWSTYWLGQYILSCTGKQYKSKTSQYLLFQEARLSFHLPGRRSEKADRTAADAWVAKQTDGRSRLLRAWKDPGTVILCEDEMVLTSGTTRQKVWLPVGAYPPVIETNRTRQRKSVYGFLDLKAGTEHAYQTDWQNMFITVEVLGRLRQQYPTQSLLLVWDNCGWHKGSAVMQWVKRDKRTKLLFFPAYAPELNPQEHVWKAGRKAVTHNRHIADIEHVTSEFVAHITSRQFGYELCGLSASSAGQV
jgi:hypothetical protein